MISTIEFKRCIISASILGVVVSKFRHKKKLCLIILLKVDKSLEINFYYIVLPLSLAVHLRVEGDKKSLLNAKEIA